MNETRTHMVNVQGKGPVAKAKSGKFEVSIWHYKKFVPQPDETKDLFPERELDVHRACLRFSQWNRGTRDWDETIIWCSIDDLRDLVQALDGLNFEE